MSQIPGQETIEILEKRAEPGLYFTKVLIHFWKSDDGKNETIDAYKIMLHEDEATLVFMQIEVRDKRAKVTVMHEDNYRARRQEDIEKARELLTNVKDYETFKKLLHYIIYDMELYKDCTIAMHKECNM